jgi:hypothetical protein
MGRDGSTFWPRNANTTIVTPMKTVVGMALMAETQTGSQWPTARRNEFEQV